MSDSNGLYVVVLAGGISHERDVSLRSGRRVADALTEAGHRVELRDPDAGLLPFLAERPMRNKAVAAYVCEHFACLPPVTDPGELSGVIQRGTGISWSEF